MINEKKLELILKRFYRRYNKFNSKVLKELGNIVKQFEDLTEEEAYRLAEILKLDEEELFSELEIINRKTLKDIDELYDKIAKNILDDAEIYYLAQGIKFIDFSRNKELKEVVNNLKKITKRDIARMSERSNIGFVTKEGDTKVFTPLSKTYNRLIDKAVYEAVSGKKSYNTVMSKTLKQLARSGIKVHQDTILYESGYNQRIDSAIRRNVFDGIRQANIEMQREVGRQFGADGWQIDAHTPCAPDHEDIQGKQYTNEEFEELNAELVRPIGMLNCTHHAFQIKLGVSEPDYTKEELQEMKRQSNEKIEYDGKTYTRYEATQVQRRLETAIRKQKDMNIIAKASNDTKLVDKTQQKIKQLTYKYNDFSKSAGLETQKDRLVVSGYRR